MAVEEELAKMRESAKGIPGGKEARQNYSFFMERQIRKGRAFAQALRLWKAYSKSTPSPKTPPAANSTAKTPENRTKKNPGKKNNRKKKIRAKKPLSKANSKTPAKKPRAKKPAKTPEKNIPKKSPLKARVLTKNPPKTSQKNHVPRLPPATVTMVSNEEIAMELTRIYFSSVAPHRVKRGVGIESLARAYFYALEKVSENKPPSASSGTTTK